MADLSIRLGRLQPPLAKTPFDASRLKRLFEEADLTAERLALLVHCSVLVDLGHESPVVYREFVELAAEGGVRGSGSTEGGDEPCGQCPSGVLVVVVVIYRWGVQVGNE